MVDVEAVRRVLEATHGDLAGPAALLAACRLVVRLRWDLGELPADLIDLLVVIESELDDVPDETVAKLWNREAVQQVWRERDEYLTRVWPEVVRCLRGIRAHLTAPHHHP